MSSGAEDRCGVCGWDDCKCEEETMSLTHKDDALNEEWAKTETVSGVRPITPEQLYDMVSKTYANVAIAKMGDTWVFGRMVPLGEVSEDAKVRRLGDTYGIEVIVESSDWGRLVSKVLKARGKETF